jgi:hypothetical protein
LDPQKPFCRHLSAKLLVMQGRICEAQKWCTALTSLKNAALAQIGEAPENV